MIGGISDFHSIDRHISCKITKSNDRTSTCCGYCQRRSFNNEILFSDHISLFTEFPCRTSSPLNSCIQRSYISCITYEGRDFYMIIGRNKSTCLSRMEKTICRSYVSRQNFTLCHGIESQIEGWFRIYSSTIKEQGALFDSLPLLLYLH